MAVSVFAFIDHLATLAFLAAAVIGVKNYQDTGIEQTFWATFVLVSVAACTWMALVTVEWAGISGTLIDTLSTSLEAIVIGVFAIGSIGTLAVVQDLKESRAETENQRREAERSRKEAERQSEEAEKPVKKPKSHDSRPRTPAKRLILSAVIQSRYSPPRGGEHLETVTVDSIRTGDVGIGVVRFYHRPYIPISTCNTGRMHADTRVSAVR